MDKLTPPSDPRPGDTFEIPAGHEEDNHSQVLSIYNLNDECLGFTEGIKRIPNVSGAFSLDRSTFIEAVTIGSKIEVRTVLFPVSTMEFVNFFGWTTMSYRGDPQTLWSKQFEVVAVSLVPHPNSRQYLYKRICLQEYKENPDD